MDYLVNYLKDFFINGRIRDVIDILIVTIIFYNVFIIIRGTRAEQLSKGIIILLILTKVTEMFKIYTANWILTNLIQIGFLALLIVFQPELRRGLEFIGRFSSIKGSFNGSRLKKVPEVVIEICDAVASLSRQKIGALIVIERKTGLNEIVDTGTKIDGYVTSSLLINIFIPNTPLHDGAVIIKNDRVLSAASFLPLSDNTAISKDLGTRHRAAIGMSERSDSLSIVVSEETGAISIAEHGIISRHLDLLTLEKILNDIYSPSIDTKGFSFIKWRDKSDDEEIKE